MTPERLRAIEDRLPDFTRPGTTERDTLDLIDEVRRLRERQEDHDLVNEAIRWKRKALRLRAGVEALEKSMRQNWGDEHRAHSPYEMGCQTCAADALSRLLNPTEGEDR